MKKILILLISCFLSQQVLAESISNKALMKACKDKGAGPQNFCFGFIIATANAAQFYRNIVDTQDNYVDICFPADISNKDIVSLYMDWAEKNPSVADSPAFIGVSTSFSIKYSCAAKPELESSK